MRIMTYKAYRSQMDHFAYAFSLSKHQVDVRRRQQHDTDIVPIMHVLMQFCFDHRAV